MKRFKKALVFFVTMSLAPPLAILAAGASYGPVTLVNPLVGTANGGNTFPGAVAPWGMVSVSPHNDLQSASGYVSGRPFLYGFGHVHLSGAESPALGNVTLMPTTGEVKPGLEGRKSAYDSESAFPGYYKTRLKNYGLLAEMTATTRAGLSRYTFGAQKGDANILVDAAACLATDRQKQVGWGESSVRVVSNQEVEGVSAGAPSGRLAPVKGPLVYFVARFSKAAEQCGTWKDGALSTALEQKGKDVGAFLRFTTAEGEPIEVKVGISYVSLDNARLNLQAEIPDWDFEAVMRKSLADWDGELSKIRVTGGQAQDRKIFYTALYHCLLEPSLFNDVNGQYAGFGNSGVKNARDYNRYSFFDLTPTQRCLHPLLALVYPQVELDMAKSLVEMGKEGPFLPRRELAGDETGEGVGAPAAVVLADAYLKGLTGFDAAAGLAEALKILGPDSGAPYAGMGAFLKLGFVPQDWTGDGKVWGSASAGLEYAQSFWALSQWAQALGQEDLSKAALSKIGAYHSLYDPATRFLRPRNQDGSLSPSFDPNATCCDQPWPGSGGPGFYEGTAWQYLFDVPQDLEGLKMLLGGPLGFAKRLEAFLTQQGYDPGNSVDLDAPYLFDGVRGQEWKTQEYVRRFLAQDYGPNADGLPGHDQAGTLSAWYVFSAMGFYPVGAGSPLYQLGSPLFQKVEVEVDKSFYAGDNLVVKTLDNSPRNPYLQSVQLNGLSAKSFFLTHDQLTRGGVLALKMGPHPPGEAPAPGR